MAYDGGAAAAPTLPVDATAEGPAGTSTDVLVEAQDGYFAGDVTANRTAAVMLKATYDPRWHVTVDGKAASPYMVVPGFVAVTVGPGAHTIVFQYAPYGGYGLLLGIGVLSLVLLAIGPWLWRKRVWREIELRARALRRKTA